MGRNAYRYAALAAATSVILLWVVANEADELRTSELAVIMMAAALVLTVQIGVFALAGRVFRFAAAGIMEAAAEAYFVLTFALNAFFFGFILVETSTSTQMLYAAAAGAAMAAVLWLRRWGAIFFIFAAVFAVQSIYRYVDTRIEVNSYRNVEIRSLPFRDGRNVYLISFESLPSPQMLRDLYGADNLKHVEYLRANGFRVFDEAFSADSATKTSYQRMLEFSRRLKTRADYANVLKRGNSTFRSFKDSGYKIQLLYRSNYLDLNSGIVDHAFPADGFYICDNLPPSFGYFVCRDKFVERINAAIFDVRPISYQDQIEHLRQRVDDIVGGSDSWLTINHIAFPNHTPLNFVYDDAAAAEAFKSWMRSNIPEVAEGYRKTIGYILEHDPDSIIITFGDHGAWLSRGVETVEGMPVRTSMFTLAQVVRDRHSTMLAVYPADFCVNRIFDGSATTTLTESLLRCLGGDDSPSEEERAKSRSIFFGRPWSIDELLKRG